MKTRLKEVLVAMGQGAEMLYGRNWRLWATMTALYVGLNCYVLYMDWKSLMVWGLIVAICYALPITVLKGKQIQEECIERFTRGRCLYGPTAKASLVGMVMLGTVGIGWILL
jgi:hypothetical protein